MSMLENIMRGRESKPPRLFIYGQEGVGKSRIWIGLPQAARPSAFAKAMADKPGACQWHA